MPAKKVNQHGCNSEIENVICWRYSALNKQGKKESKKIALAEAYLIAKNINASDANYYRLMLEEVNDTVVYRDRGQIIEAVVKKWVSASADGDKFTLKVVQLPDGLFSKSAGGRRDQALEVIQNLFSTLIGATTPEVRGLAGKFIEELVDQESERFFTQRIRPKLDEGFDQMASTAAGERLAEMETKNERREDGRFQRSEIESIRNELVTARQEINEANIEHQEHEQAEHPIDEKFAKP